MYKISSKLYYKDIISEENLLISWKEFLRGKRKRKDVAEFSVHFFDNIMQLHSVLFLRTYTHSLYESFSINDPKPRAIHKASVRDRLLHHAIYRILYPYFDTKFIYHSYSCRENKGTHKALIAFQSMSRKVGRNNTQTVWVLKCDIKKFFASIDHKILNEICAKHIYDSDILDLLNVIIDSFHTKECQCRQYYCHCERERSNRGLPLGNLTSQLLVNVYMNEFDQWVKHRLKAKYYIRYADDFVILHTDKHMLENYLKNIHDSLREHLQLELHPKKVLITTLASGVDFLGWVHFPRHRVLRTVTKRRMFKNLERKEYKEESVQSYLGMLKHGDAYNLSNKVLKIKKIK